MSKKPKNDSITIPEFIPVFNQIPGLNTAPLDYKLLKNRP